MMSQPKILIMAGGTGGHIFPGIAVADNLKAKGWEVHWLGTKTRMEADIVPAHGYNISFINIAGIRNKGLIDWLKLPFKMLASLRQSIKVIKETKPDVVLGMGGYASGPGGVAAWLMRKPLVLHEQNAVAGMTNRYLAYLASRVLSAFPNAFSSMKRQEVVGNPVRAAFDLSEASKDPSAESSRDTRLLVVGGSLGAKVLNDTVPQAISQMTNQSLSIWHQTGKGHLASVEENYQQVGVAGETVKLTEFIDDMAAAYQWADVVICRAGALTVSELAMAGKPAIFVPLPHAVDDHQTQNAMYLVDRGAAKLIKQHEFNGTSLAQMLNSLLSSQINLNAMANAAQQAAHKDATERVAQICQEYVQ